MIGTGAKNTARSLRQPPGEDPRSQAVRYLLIAGSGYVLAVLAYASLLAVGVPPYAAIAITFVANGVFNFILARLWAFPQSGRRVRSEFTRFCAVAAGSLLINYASFAVLYTGLGIAATASQAVAILIAAPFGFLANRLWSFRSS